MYALVDCNNFYASCERLFRPDLRNKPIVVLSNNDGCIIARSNEAKQLGIKMGEPYFKIKALCKQHNVHVFSSNFPLYGDLSKRVMSVIQDAWPVTEIYSIDEAFLNLQTLPISKQFAFCKTLHQSILKATGIPTSIGLGSTKTLAKISNHICKKELYVPVFNIEEEPEWLKRVAIGDVWGVGRQWQLKLKAQGIHTAHDLANVNLQHYKHIWNVMLIRTAMELRGIACFTRSEKPQQSILSSKSFNAMQTEFSVLAEALSNYAARAFEKLRNNSLTTQSITVFIHTNRHRQDLAVYNPSIEIKLTHPTDDIRIITTEAKNCLRKIFKPGFYYKKIGIKLDTLAPKTKANYQYDLFDNNHESLVKTELLMSTLDSINEKFGRNTLKLAATGQTPTKPPTHITRSPCYTTQWNDLVIVKNMT